MYYINLEHSFKQCSDAHSIPLELCFISKLYSQVFTHSSSNCMRETQHEGMCENSLHEGLNSHIINRLILCFSHLWKGLAIFWRRITAKTRSSGGKRSSLHVTKQVNQTSASKKMANMLHAAK